MPISNGCVVVQIVDLQIMMAFLNMWTFEACTYSFHFKGLGLIWETPFFIQLKHYSHSFRTHQVQKYRNIICCADGKNSFDMLFNWCLSFFFLSFFWSFSTVCDEVRYVFPPWVNALNLLCSNETNSTHVMYLFLQTCSWYSERRRH